jgi:hypothetical protein
MHSENIYAFSAVVSVFMPCAFDVRLDTWVLVYVSIVHLTTLTVADAVGLQASDISVFSE